MGVTTTGSPCSDGIDAPNHTNSTVSGTCVVGCITGPELASDNNFQSVSKNDGITVLAGYFTASVGGALLDQHKPGTHRSEPGL